MATILGRKGQEITAESVLNHSGKVLSHYENVRQEGRYIVGDLKPKYAQPEGALYRGGSDIFFAHPGHSIEPEIENGTVEVVAVLDSHFSAYYAAEQLNTVNRCTLEQLACEDTGKVGRTSRVGLAPVPYNCPKCGVKLVPAFGAFMKHPSIEDVPGQVRHLLKH